MTSLIVGFIYLTGLYPLLRAWQANRRTSLFQAVHWADAAWVAWGLTVGGEALEFTPGAIKILRYIALCLTGAAGVAVLGARRPGVGPWNFVLLGFLAVMLLPPAEGLLAHGAWHLEGPRTLFLAAMLVVIVLNYLPTRLGPAALLLGAGAALHLSLLGGSEELRETLATYTPIANLLLAIVPWAALERIASRPTPPSEFDRIWLVFRDRFGLVWSQRLREQFNNAANHAGWPVILRWQGLRIIPGSAPPSDEAAQAMLDALNALMKRFRSESEG
jgi:hypothetical protein